MCMHIAAQTLVAKCLTHISGTHTWPHIEDNRDHHLTNKTSSGLRLTNNDKARTERARKDTETVDISGGGLAIWYYISIYIYICMNIYIYI